MVKIKHNYMNKYKLAWISFFTAVIVVALFVILIFSIGCSKTKSNSDVTIGIANVTHCSEFYLYAREAAESTGAKVVDLDQVMPAYYTYENTPKPKTYSSPEVEKIFKENHYGESTFYDLTKEQKDERNGLAWNYAVEMGIYTTLPSNITKVLEGIDAVIVPGGEDISNGIFFEDVSHVSDESRFQAANDISDSLLVSYCIENDIPILGICRGMQMFCISQGSGVVDDIKDYFENGKEYNEMANMHRDPDSQNRFFVPHDVELSKKIGTHDSLLYKIIGSDSIKNVPSWHHQLIHNVDKTPLYTSAITPTGGHDFIEAVEHPLKKFAIGVQFHIEVPIYLANHNDPRASEFMDVELSKKFFQAFVDAAK